MEREIARLTRAVVALIATQAPEPQDSEIEPHLQPFERPRPEAQDPATKRGLESYLNYRGGYSAEWHMFSKRDPMLASVCEKIGLDVSRWEQERARHIHASRRRAVQILKVRWALDLLRRVEFEDPA